MRQSYLNVSSRSKNDISDRLEGIEQMLYQILKQERFQQHYSVAEFAVLVERAEFTVREWCRLGRLNANKKTSGRGPHKGWVISHAELLRFQRDGLLTPSEPSSQSKTY